MSEVNLHLTWSKKFAMTMVLRSRNSPTSPFVTELSILTFYNSLLFAQWLCNYLALPQQHNHIAYIITCYSLLPPPGLAATSEACPRC